MAAQDSPARRHLSDLVRRRRAELRISLARLAARTIDPDDPQARERVKEGWIHRLEHGKRVIPPELPELQALADGLELPLAVVQEAAASQFFGIDSVWSTSGEVRALVANVERMTPEQIAQLRRFIASFTPDEDD